MKQEPPHTHARLDGVGLWLSGLCAVHCMVMPVVLLFFPVLTWIHWSRLMDFIALAVAAVIGLGGCWLGHRHHRQIGPLCLVLAGLALNATGRLAGMWLAPVLSQTLTAGGPLVMAYGMWRDRRLCTHARNDALKLRPLSPLAKPEWAHLHAPRE